MAEPLPIAVEQVTKVYRRGLALRPFRALDGVSFTVPRGQVVGYLGRNGSGKTTTMKMLVGLMSPTTGRVSLFGRDPRERGARRDVGFLPETPSFYEYLTAREGLIFYARLQGLDRAAAAAATPPLLERVGLREAMDVPIHQFSKGMRQRFGVAQAIVGDPAVVILDEPLEGLDPIGRRTLKDLIRELRRADRAVLLSTHVLPDVEDLCDRVVMLEGGRVVADGTLHALAGTAVTHVLVAHGVPEAARAVLTAAASGVQVDGERLRLTLPPGVDPDALVRAIHAAGGRLEALEPRRESLEDLFLRLTRPAA